MFDLTNKIAIVTGAQRGMGRTHALALSKQGAKVAVTDIDETKCQTVVDEIKAIGGDAMCFKMDVVNTEEINEVFDKVIAQWGRLDILVNNAGIYSPMPALDMTEEEWSRTININLKGYFFCAQRAAKEMAKNKWGRIVNIASVASGQVGIGVNASAHYTASKGGIIGMTETLAIEWAPLGINVNVIGPGMIDTPMVQNAGIPKDQLNTMLERVPLRRMGKPEEISSAVVFLSSEEASYITGATLFVDGGWLAS